MPSSGGEDAPWNAGKNLYTDDGAILSCLAMAEALSFPSVCSLRTSCGSIFGLRPL